MGLFSSNDIRIEIPKYIFSPGEVVHGKIITSISDPVKADIFTVAFYGNSSHKAIEWSNGQNREVTKTTEFYRENITLGGKGSYDSYEYMFSFTIPENLWSCTTQNSSSGNPSVIEELISVALSHSDSLRGIMPNIVSYSFFIEACMDIPWGIDIRENIEINIQKPMIQNN